MIGCRYWGTELNSRRWNSCGFNWFWICCGCCVVIAKCEFRSSRLFINIYLSYHWMAVVSFSGEQQQWNQNQNTKRVLIRFWSFSLSISLTLEQEKKWLVLVLNTRNIQSICLFTSFCFTTLPPSCRIIQWDVVRSGVVEFPLHKIDRSSSLAGMEYYCNKPTSRWNWPTFDIHSAVAPPVGSLKPPSGCQFMYLYTVQVFRATTTTTTLFTTATRKSNDSIR